MWGQGTTLSGRFTLGHRLGGGMMGEVWAASDEVLGRAVAVKIILPALLADPDFAARFRAEARVMAMIDHPGVVDVYDYGESADDGDGRPLAYVVMELIAGHSLADELDGGGRLSPARTLDVVAQTAAALQAVHDQGVIHRDVKPSNLMVRPDGSVVLTDFGIARSGHSGSTTGTGMVLGSASYMAPETVTDRAVPASDQYALGVMAFQCLTGSVPFVAENAAAVLYAQVNSPVPPLPSEVPAAAREIVERALAKQPEARWPTADAMAAAAREAQSRLHLPPQVQPPIQWPRGPAPQAEAATHRGTPVPDPRATMADRPRTAPLAETAAGTARAGRAQPAPTPAPGSRRNTLLAAAAAAVIAMAGTAFALSGSKTPRHRAGLDRASQSPVSDPAGQSGGALIAGGSSGSGTPKPSGPPKPGKGPNPSSPSTPGDIGGSSSAGGVPVTGPGGGPISSVSASTPSTSGSGSVTYSAVAGFSCPSLNGAGYSEVGAVTSGAHTGWYTENGGFTGAGCQGKDRFLPLTGTPKDSGAHIEWIFRPTGIQQGVCKVEMHVPVASATGGDADLGGGAVAHYVVLSRASYVPIDSFDVDQEKYPGGSWHAAGTYPVTGGVLGLWLVDRGVPTQTGLAWPAHFAADVVRVTCTGR